MRRTPLLLILLVSMLGGVIRPTGIDGTTPIDRSSQARIVACERTSGDLPEMPRGAARPLLAIVPGVVVLPPSAPRKKCRDASSSSDPSGVVPACLLITPRTASDL